VGRFSRRRFTEPQIEKAAAEPEQYSAALVFSTKYDPPPLLKNFGLGGEAMEERFFGLHHDLPPEQIAHQLGGTLVWSARTTACGSR